jgi:hypothetical protein
MKEGVSRELAREGYSIFFEPPYSPSILLRWASYRPDVLGIKASEEVQEYVFVECETRPSGRKLAAKNFRSVEAQARLGRQLSLRKILVLPRGKLACVEPAVRHQWEMWIFEGNGFRRFPRVPASHASHPTRY